MQHYGHYTFPDPGLFITPATDENKAQNVESWLRLREIWFLRVANELSLALSNQHWWTFLSMDHNAQEQRDTKAARRRREVLDLIMPKSNVYPELKARGTSKDPLFWEGKEYPSGELPPEDVVRQILWELYELNFIHELSALDRRACADLDIMDTTKVLERQLSVSACFCPSSFQHVTIPSENAGLAADNFGQRYHFIVALFLVMKSWKGKKPVIFGASEDAVCQFSLEAAKGFEKLITKYYCQQFFNYFGRAAQIPHRLFVVHDK